MNTNINLEEYKIYLEKYLTDFHNINNTRQLFNCLNPYHEDRHPSMGFTPRFNICKCFSCGAKYDIFDLVKLDFGLNNFRDQINKVREIYEGVVIEPIQLKNNYSNIENDNDYTNYFKYCVDNINETDYLQLRGITSDLIEKYKIGYDKKNKRIVFPIKKNCYFARSIENSAKLKSKGISYLWNEELLYNSTKDDLIYLTESIIDALSLQTIKKDIKVVSLNGVSNVNRVIDVCKKNNFQGCFVIVFDNDSHGLKAQEMLREELIKLNIDSFSTTLVSNFDDKNCKDVNEGLLKNKNLLEQNLNYVDEAVHEVMQKKNKLKEREYELQEK